MRANSPQVPVVREDDAEPAKWNGCRFVSATTASSEYVTPRTWATMQVGASLDERKRRLRSNDGRVVARYVNGSSGRRDAGSHAFIPKPARLRNVFIIRGRYDCRTRLLSVSNSRLLRRERLPEVG